MKTGSIFFFIFLFLFTDLPAQPKAGYHTSDHILELLKKDSTPWKDQWGAFLFSLTGQYQQSLELADRQFKNIKEARQLSPEAFERVNAYQPVIALDYLVERAAKESIIIINEAHHQPLHRVFTTSLLEGLYQKGFRYLGLETLSNTDTGLQHRGYPALESGVYTQEPQFGNMVREALRLGFTVFGYESEEEDMRPAKREPAQARNIATYMKKHPGKYLIHCGYAHVTEGREPAWGKAMAGYLKEYTKIDPLTVNQEALTEHSNALYEQPDYPAISSNVSSVLINHRKEVYNGYANDSLYDIRLYHPRTSFLHGRPDWLFVHAPQRKPYFIPDSLLDYGYELPLLVFAWKAGEDIDAAVPCDVIEIKHAGERIAMALSKGVYTFLLKDKEGKSIQWEKEVY